VETFLFINIIITALNIFILAYAYSLKFFPIKWRKKVNQDTLVGLAIIFITMLNMFMWIIYFYYEIFDPLKEIKELIT
jgi:hypothetical protein|tara:strand:+ start:1977 stop:2210 length:234 start_codon:yes stop_codon:yes gene_type:complete